MHVPPICPIRESSSTAEHCAVFAALLRHCVPLQCPVDDRAVRLPWRQATGSCAPTRLRLSARLLAINPPGTIGAVGRAMFLAAKIATRLVGAPEFLMMLAVAQAYRAPNKNAAYAPKYPGTIPPSGSPCCPSPSGCTKRARANVNPRFVVMTRVIAAPTGVKVFSRLFATYRFRVAAPMSSHDRQNVQAG